VSPEWGRSEAESLDRIEASRRIGVVMAGVLRPADRPFERLPIAESAPRPARTRRLDRAKLSGASLLVGEPWNYAPRQIVGMLLREETTPLDLYVADGRA
jgi:hypothetical protein